MNNDRMEGAWKQMKGKMKQSWGKLTDDDLDVAEGQWDELSGKIQSRYGKSKDEAEKEIQRFREDYDREVARDISR